MPVDYNSSAVPSGCQKCLPSLVTLEHMDAKVRLASELRFFREIDEYGSVPALELDDKQRLSLNYIKGSSRSTLYVRVMLVLRISEQLVAEGKTATQRDIFYRLKSLFPVFKTPDQVNDAIVAAAKFLNTPRYTLGFICSSRGAAAGSLIIQANLPSGAASLIDCSQCQSGSAAGFQIPGDPTVILNYIFMSRCRYIIIVEKEAIFQRLAEDRIWEQVPCILITGKGFPDVCTKMFASLLSEAMPHIPVLGLVDWNPFGVCILNNYKNGSQTGIQEAGAYTIPSLHWFGARWHALQNANPAHFQPLTPLDHTKIKTLLSSGELRGDWREEVEIMQARNIKAEIELLCNGAGTECNGFSAMIIQSFLAECC